MTRTPLTRRSLQLLGGLLTVLATLPVLGAGCAVSTSPESDEETSNGDSELSGAEAIARAEEWVDVKMPYCQAANHQRDYDDACSTYCSRPDNSDWDPYRSDCSGLVSWAWGLPAPGRVTSQFAP